MPKLVPESLIIRNSIEFTTAGGLSFQVHDSCLIVATRPAGIADITTPQTGPLLQVSAR
jgi:hypothetical protein